MTENEKIARRKLLRIGVYTAPLVLGTLLYSANAGAQTGSCQPTTCSPNNPIKPCGPNACKPES